jgi:hypothetical protein
MPSGQGSEMGKNTGTPRRRTREGERTIQHFKISFVDGWLVNLVSDCMHTVLCQVFNVRLPATLHPIPEVLVCSSAFKIDSLAERVGHTWQLLQKGQFSQ